MVRGLHIFRDHFSAFQDHYVLIGGAAVDVLLSEAGLPARATKDLDVVLLVEAVDGEFGEVFWDFIEKGGYSNCSKSTGEVCFYRFHSPSDQTYPMMIELLSRRPDGIELLRVRQKRRHPQRGGPSVARCRAPRAAQSPRVA